MLTLLTNPHPEQTVCRLLLEAHDASVSNDMQVAPQLFHYHASEGC